MVSCVVDVRKSVVALLKSKQQSGDTPCRVQQIDTSVAVLVY